LYGKEEEGETRRCEVSEEVIKDARVYSIFSSSFLSFSLDLVEEMLKDVEEEV